MKTQAGRDFFENWADHASEESDEHFKRELGAIEDEAYDRGRRDAHAEYEPSAAAEILANE